MPKPCIPLALCVLCPLMVGSLIISGHVQHPCGGEIDDDDDDAVRVVGLSVRPGATDAYILY